ncbi:hypothetical protein NL676_011070 [Syzygium grande]|nr:hypothetical protein NL676_011070 [Syzygium grande]
MGKKGGTSWLTRVKRAFRSPAKDDEKRNGRRREECGQEDEERKREKRRWLFRKSGSNHPTDCETKEAVAAAAAADICTVVNPVMVDDQRHAIAVAAATAAAAEAAVATAQAAMEIARLTRPPSSLTKENRAAVVIQTAFRGYLARRALRALKGLVKLQALVRGHNVRKQAKLTLQCMQALVRVQDRIRDQRARLSHEGSRKSMFDPETSNLWESSYLQDIRERRSVSRNTSCTADFWDEHLFKMEDVEALLQSGKEIASQREKLLSQAFSQQIWRSRRHPSAGNETELEERTKWLDRWMATKPWETESRASTDKKDPIKTVEIDTSQPYSQSTPRNHRRSFHQNHYIHRQPTPSPTPHSVSSPVHRSHSHHINPSLHHSPVTPSPAKARPIQVRSASPRCYREDQSYSAANTPSLAFLHRNSTAVPNYMAATESAKARSRSQSAPRQRLSTPERDRTGSAKKRLSYPAPDPHGGFGIGYGPGGVGQNLRSPSFKSVYSGHYTYNYGGEHRSNLSCYTESIGGEISPCSTTDLRWFR